MPFNYPLFTRSCALGPCPWPSEIDSVFRSISFANLIKSVTGSLPGDSKNIKGVKFVESLKHFGRSNVGGMMNSLPNLTLIQDYIPGKTLSILIAFKMISF